jgi:hypothetical protein
MIFFTERNHALLEPDFVHVGYIAALSEMSGSIFSSSIQVFLSMCWFAIDCFYHANYYSYKTFYGATFRNSVNEKKMVNMRMLLYFNWAEERKQRWAES